MRLIATLPVEKEAFQLSTFLKSQDISNGYEPFVDAERGVTVYQIWVVREEDMERACLWVEKFQQDPADPTFHPKETLMRADIEGAPPQLKGFFRPALTHFLIAVCAILFVWNATEEQQIEEKEGKLAEEVKLSPLHQNLFFDFPASYVFLEKELQGVSLQGYKEIKDLPPEVQALFKKAEQIPYWQGLVPVIMDWKGTGWHYLRTVPLFEKIGQGEVWRLFTPTLLHADFLHLLFNMVWLLFLGKQIEERLKIGKMALFVLIAAVVSNLAQYAISGPYFLGFSGVILAMVGYIWIRQRSAPWEGYPLQRSVLNTIFFFVIAMFALDLIASVLQLLEVTTQSLHIANTAHLVGGAVGICLGKIRFFSKGRS